MMKNPIFDLEIGGRLIHEFDLYTSKYGSFHKSRINSKNCLKKTLTSCIFLERICIDFTKLIICDLLLGDFFMTFLRIST